MRSIQKGFTLVELIVVIVILAVLGTISFISFTSYNQSARNSIRLDGISKVATVLENQKIGGKNLIGFTFGGQEVPSASIAGTGAIIGVNYAAGDINPTAVNVQLRQFSDPVTGASYKVGVTNKKKGQYEIATTIREGNTFVAKLAGTYRSRSQMTFVGTGDIGSKQFALASPSDIRKILIGDIVTGTGFAVDTEVVNISSDGQTIILGTALTGTGTGIRLGNDEVEGLILGEGTVSSPVIHNGSDVPYIIGS